MAVVSQHRCPVLVGRTSELTRLKSLLDESAHGQARLAVITGEAGVGKSRVVRELLARASERHALQTLVGSCRELDLDFPFAPIADALRQKLAEEAVDARDPPLDGIVVRRPRPESNADRAGLSAGDVILAVDGQETRSYEAFLDSMRGHAPGEEARLRVRRRTGNTQEIALTR